ncbi:hypothetical protein [Bradyrhizobium sp. 187]|uniref:hypothetical protein n=1 Tax=Bradyrhizobium sp. 187 TaxID=2782655 RepID=UPI001FFF19CB|nr:hypothetical protein [Bradyrhizobium sp. 187]UPJ74478.1 hypothetical protein IVB19_08070 [Bradyrhizobium sp. 187]
MSFFFEALRELRNAPTLTERVYIISPLLMAALKDVSDFTGVSSKRTQQVANKIAAEVAQRNQFVLKDDEPLIIRAGPFAGMRYIRYSAGSLLGAKIFGTYETEIGHWFSEAIAGKKNDLFIDVGAAEGYYAVGMARACPDIPVHAFDINPSAQQMAGDLARANQVSQRVSIGGRCTPEQLETLLADARNPLLLVDIEGFEDQFLDPKLAPHLKAADIIVELHEHKKPGVTYRILNRFRNTHRIEAVAAIPDAWKLDDARRVSDETTGLIDVIDIQEGRRIPQLWLRMISQSNFAQSRVD